MDSRLYWIWLQQALEPGSEKSGPALTAFSRPEYVYDARQRDFEEVGFSGKELERLCDKSMESAKRIFQATLHAGDWLLTPDDAYYPDLLRGIYGLPLVLYGRGEWPSLDQRPAIAMVGTRHPSNYGLQTAARLSAGLAAGGMVVISGGARGIDAAAHEAALNVGGVTMAIQACGLDVNYPQPNVALRARILSGGGAILTEYPPGTRPAGYHFPVRNRILSGLAYGVCVVEAPHRSGALITANRAREQGRDVFAVPGDITSDQSNGSNGLIQQGAQLVTNACEILEEYRLRFFDRLDFDAAEKAERQYARFVSASSVSNPPPVQNTRQKAERAEKPPVGAEPVPPAKRDCSENVSEDAKRVFAAMSDTPQPIDLLAQAVELPAAQVLVALTELELCGCIRSFAGQQYGY